MPKNVKNVFVCACTSCLRDGGPLFWQRADGPRASLTWVRTSAAARRGYGAGGEVLQIEYVWGSCYDCVAPTLEAANVPFALFLAVRLAEITFFKRMFITCSGVKRVVPRSLNWCVLLNFRWSLRQVLFPH